MLAPGRCLGTAHSVNNQGVRGSMDARPFRPYRPRFARKLRFRHDPKMTQRKAMYNLLALEHFDQMLGPGRCLGTAHSVYNPGFTDQ